MKYTYDIYENNSRVGTTTNIAEIKDSMVLNPFGVVVFDNVISKKTPITVLNSLEELESWREARDRDIWLDPPLRFEVYNHEAKLLQKYSSLEKLEEDCNLFLERYNPIKVYKGNRYIKTFDKFSDLKEWIETPNQMISSDIGAWASFSNSITTEEAIQSAVDPKHYKGYIDDMEWIEAMSKIPTLRNTDIFCGALELQVRKYLDRRGNKDHSLLELKKARFYLQCWIAFIETGKIDAKATHERFV